MAVSKKAPKLYEGDGAGRERIKKEPPTVPYEHAGIALLAAQPAVPKKDTRAETKEWQELRGHLETRLAGLRNWRNSWWMQNWSQLSQYIEPRRSIWLTQSTGGQPTPNNMIRGRAINECIVDPTGTLAVRNCVGGMVSGLCSQSRPWFKVVPAIKNFSPSDDARAWMDDIEDKAYAVLAQSNFYSCITQEVEDLIVFGTGPTFIYEDERDVIRCYNSVCGEYYLASDATCRIDGFFRLFVMTVSQMVGFFGVENCPPDVQGLWEQKGNGLDTERLVAHSIEPNFGIHGKGIGVVPGGFPWREIYWAWGSGAPAPLSMRGFMEQPFTAARWSIQSNDAYGRSVGMDVLPDIVQLQIETLRKAEAIEKQVRPPLVADMELKNQPASILPGEVTYVANLSAKSGMRPIYEVMPDIKGMMEDLAAIQERIKKGFFNDLFLPLNDMPQGQRTAFETAQIINERLQILGPVIENLLNESLKPKLKRVFGIMLRKGIIPPKPASLRGVKMDFEFVSMLALAQKAAATGGIERLVALAGNMVGVYGKAVTNTVDAEEILRIMSDLLGNPQRALRSADKVAAMNQQDVRDQQAAQQQQALAQGAQTVSTGAAAAQTMANTQIGASNNVLGALLGGGGSQ